MTMWGWIKGKISRYEEKWLMASQVPGATFPLPKDWRLKAREEVPLAFPKALVGKDEILASIIRCDDDAQFGYPPDQDVILMRLMPGMVLSLSRSCQVVVVAEDDRPRQLALLKPADTNTE